MLANFIILFLYYGTFLGIGIGITYLLRLNKLKSLAVLALLLLVAIMIKKVIKTSAYARIEVEILNPSNGIELEGKSTMISGKSSRPKATVFLLIHPKSTLSYWVQDPIKADDLGNWQGIAYLGTDSLGINDTYEVLALSSTPNLIFNVLLERYYYPGQILNELPELGKSNIISIQRIK